MNDYDWELAYETGLLTENGVMMFSVKGLAILLNVTTKQIQRAIKNKKIKARSDFITKCYFLDEVADCLYELEEKENGRY